MNPQPSQPQCDALPIELRPPHTYSIFTSLGFVARPEGVEPPTSGLEGRCSIQLSYGRMLRVLIGLASSDFAPRPRAQPRCNQTHRLCHPLRPTPWSPGRFNGRLQGLRHAGTNYVTTHRDYVRRTCKVSNISTLKVVLPLRPLAKCDLIRGPNHIGVLALPGRNTCVARRSAITLSAGQPLF